jgi:cytosine/creatinine deaminase
VIALPQTNLFLQARDSTEAMPRGLTAVKALVAAGVRLAAGADNLQDPFNLVGRGDPLETASLMVTSGHVLPAQAYELVAEDARVAVGAPPAAVRVGSPADLVGIPARTPREAVAFQPPGRIVIRRGRPFRTIS